MMNALSIIRQKYAGMSAVERRIADLILKDPQAIIHATVVFMAANANVSEGSIVNFSRQLGFDGFSQLKINLAQNLPEEKPSYAAVSDNSGKSTLRKMVDNAVIAFQTTCDTIRDEIDTAASMLRGASRILIIGFGHSRPIAEDMALRLMRLGLNAVFESDPLQAGIMLTQMKEHDVLTAVSSSGRTKEILSAVDLAHTYGCKVIGISNYSGSPLLTNSDLPFSVVTTETKNYLEATIGCIAMMLVTQCIVEQVSIECGNEAIVYMDNVTEIYEQHRSEPAGAGEE